MAERHGFKGRVVINGTVVKQTKWTLSRTTDKVNVAGFGDTNKRYVIGMQDLQGTLAGFWDDASDALFDAADAGVPVTMFLYPDHTNTPGQYWTGQAYLDASIDVDANGAVGISGSFAASSNWTRVGLA